MSVANYVILQLVSKHVLCIHVGLGPVPCVLQAILWNSNIGEEGPIPQRKLKPKNLKIPKYASSGNNVRGEGGCGYCRDA